MKKYLAEFIGTLFLALTVILASGGQMQVLTPFLAALVVGVMVYSLGPISGAHFNPAITLGALSIKKIEGKDALFYIIAQFIGAGLASIIGGLMTQTSRDVILMKPSLFQDFFSDPAKVGFAEAIGTFFLAFGIASVIYGKTPKDASGATIGGSLLIGAVIASTISAGLLNPAVAFGVGALNLMYVVGPILGAVAGMWTYKAVSH